MAPEPMARRLVAGESWIRAVGPVMETLQVPADKRNAQPGKARLHVRAPDPTAALHPSGGNRKIPCLSEKFPIRIFTQTRLDIQRPL